MSKWYQAKEEDIEIDGDEINIYAGSDSEGSLYAVVKIEDMKKLLNL